MESNLIEVVYLLIVSYGMTTIIVYGSIFENFREYLNNNNEFFGKLITCVLCTSTWVGFFLSILVGGVSDDFFNLNLFLTTFLDGMFTAGGVWIINSVVEFFEESRIK